MNNKSDEMQNSTNNKINELDAKLQKLSDLANSSKANSVKNNEENSVSEQVQNEKSLLTENNQDQYVEYKLDENLFNFKGSTVENNQEEKDELTLENKINVEEAKEEAKPQEEIVEEIAPPKGVKLGLSGKLFNFKKKSKVENEENINIQAETVQIETENKQEKIEQNNLQQEEAKVEQSFEQRLSEKLDYENQEEQAKSEQDRDFELKLSEKINNIKQEIAEEKKLEPENPPEYVYEESPPINPKTGKIAPARILEAGFSEKTFQVCAKLSLPFLVLLTLGLCLQQFFFPRDFWITEEVRLADVYMNLLASQNFFTLTLNGMPFVEAGPLYFTLIWLIDLIPQIEMPQAFFASSIIFTTFYIIVTWALARGLGFSKQIAFASGLIMLSSYSFLALTHYIQMDIIYATFTNLSFLFFYKAWKKENGFFSLSFAFVLMACAVLIKGPFSFVLLFVATILFLIWSGNLKRLNSGDGVLGFMAFLIIILAWVAYLYFNNDFLYLKEFIQTHILNPYKIDFANKQKYYYYLFGLALISLPWIFILIFVNWFNVLRNLGKTFRNRKTETNSSWLLCIIISGLIILSIQNDQTIINLLPLMPALAILFAKALLNLSAFSSRLFFAFLALILVLSGLFAILIEFQSYILPILPTTSFLPEKIPAYINTVTTNTYFGLTGFGVILLLFALILFKFTRRSLAGGSLIVFTLALILCTQPFNILVAPQLDKIFSPKNQAQTLAKYADQGYNVATYKIYPNIYTYYYNIARDSQNYPMESIINFSSENEVNDFLSTNPKVILAVPTSILEAMPNREHSEIIESAWLENREISLTIWDSPQLETIQTPSTSPIEEQETLEESNETPVQLPEIIDEVQENIKPLEQTNNENNIEIESQENFEKTEEHTFPDAQEQNIEPTVLPEEIQKIEEIQNSEEVQNNGETIILPATEIEIQPNQEVPTPKPSEQNDLEIIQNQPSPEEDIEELPSEQNNINPPELDSTILNNMEDILLPQVEQENIAPSQE